MANRRFTGFADARRTSRALLADEPRLGRRFMKGEPNQHTAAADFTVKSQLIAKLGARGYGHLLEQLNATAGPERKPSRGRRSRGGRRKTSA